MKFVIAPDKFKGSLTGFEFCDAVEEGLRMVFPEAEILKMPLADGGDGTMEVVRHYLKGEIVTLRVNDPLFRPVASSYLYAPASRIAYIEMAEASGLKLLKDAERNCMQSTTLGTGELLAHAIQQGAREIILGIGGSATNDAGMGMAAALGFAFLDKNNKPLLPIGSNLIHVKKIDSSGVHAQLNNVRVKVACDVTNPFYGKNGAAYVYAAQKGASDEDIAQLDDGLRNFAQILDRQYNTDVQKIPGAGAAGGFGGGASVFLKATLTSGIELIKDMADLNSQIKNADWIITGEGKLDKQTLSGKTIDGVLKSANRENIPVAVFCGAIDLSEENAKEMGIAYMVAISRDMPNLEEAIKRSYENMVAATVEFAKTIN